MQGNRVPRWLVENDPSWEKAIDSNLGMLKWTKKGTGIQAVCSPTGMFCDILGQDNPDSNSVRASNLADLRSSIESTARQPASQAQDIVKYLTSRYLNPGINGPARFDIRRMRKF
jgi:hypothetical protein